MPAEIDAATRADGPEVPRPDARGGGGVGPAPGDALCHRPRRVRLAAGGCKLPRPTRSLGPCGPRSLLEGGALPKRHCAPRPHVVRESEALSSSRKAQAPFERHGRGPAFSFRSTVEAAGRSSAATRAYRTCAVDCPAGLIPGVLALYPQAGNESSTRSRSSFPSAGRDDGTVAPREPVYSWLLPTSACARTAVSRIL